jgi:two-component system CheB/CheR fusion protein
MKPVALVERALMNSSKTGDLCADLFGGSGSWGRISPSISA